MSNVDTNGKRLNLFPMKKKKKKVSSNQAFDMMESVADKTAVDIFPAEFDKSTKGIHNALMAAGMTPAYGNVADLADDTLYALEGEFGEAGWSMASFLPFIGQIVAAKKIQKGVGSLPSSVQKKLLKGDYIPNWVSYNRGKGIDRIGKSDYKFLKEGIVNQKMVQNIIRHKTKEGRKFLEKLQEGEKALKKYGIDVNDF
jgi:hypothetical protein